VRQSSFFRWIRRHPVVVTIVAVLVIAGLLSFHTIRQGMAELLAQRDYLYRRCTKIDWSPNQTQFILGSGCAEMDSIDLSVYSIDGTILYRLPSSWFGSAFWSPDGQYVAVTTCVGSHSENAYVYSIFDASSWNKLCTVGSGSGMICPKFDRTCSLPLKDRRTWFFTGHPMGAQIDISICDSVENCPTPKQ